MSKELIEAVAAEMNRLGYGYHESHAESIVLAMAKAAPVGEREAFEVWWQSVGLNDGFISYWSRLAYQAGAAHQRQQVTDWHPSGADYDRRIHSNPDAKAWADFFVATFPGLADKHDLMLGWFANAMMAMHDYLKAQQPQSAEAVAFQKPSVLKDCNVRYSISTAPQPSTVPDGWRQALGEAASEWLHENDPDGIDWCDSRHIDALLDAMLAAAPQPSAAAEVGRLVPPETDAGGINPRYEGCYEGESKEQSAMRRAAYCLSASGRHYVSNREMIKISQELYTLLAAAPSAPATVQGDGWIPVSERMPQIKQVLSEKCTLEGREIPTLYRSGFVLTFDGKQVSAGIVEWFHGKTPLSGVTHWMPLPAAPGAAPSAPKADDPVKVQLLEALTDSLELMETLCAFEGDTIRKARAAIAAARQEGGRV